MALEANLNEHNEIIPVISQNLTEGQYLNNIVCNYLSLHVHVIDCIKNKDVNDDEKFCHMI